MVDVLDVAGRPVEPLEHDRGVAVVPVVVLEDDPDPLIAREVRAVERVARVGRLGQRRNHSGCWVTQLELMPMWLGTMSLASRIRAAGAVAQVRIGRLATQVVGDPVVVERIGRGDGLAVAAHPLDPLGGLRALPQADEPQPGDAPVGEPIELVIRDRVERADVALIPARELVEPDIRALGQQDEPRHPRGVARERLRLVTDAGERRSRRGPVAVTAVPATAAAEPAMEPHLLLDQDADARSIRSKRSSRLPSSHAQCSRM